jgi:hypothetical protein
MFSVSPMIEAPFDETGFALPARRSFFDRALHPGLFALAATNTRNLGHDPCDI